mmetsp:Transcript_65114/g.130897  ORF Transcript_65114/g.130897 Transcript_65114/m.130897 type:complete len:230 (+) Transcript_65114:415-1104(+)
MVVGHLCLYHAVTFRALHVLRRFLPHHFLPGKLQGVIAEPPDADHQDRDENHPHLGVVSLLTATAALPAVRLLGVLLLAHHRLEGPLLRDHLYGLVLAPHPLQAALEEHRGELLSNPLLPLACRAACPRGVGEVGVVRSTHGDETLALAVSRVDLDEHLAAREREAEEGRHVVRLWAVRRRLAPLLGAPLLVLLHLVEDVLLHARKVASTAVDVGLRCYWLGEDEERQS